MKSTLRGSIVFALASVLSWAQSPNATVAGRVLDPSNAVVSDAKINIINLYTNIHYAGQTNLEGSFVIPNVPPGPYRIEVSKSGFKTAVREDVVLRVQDVVALNFTLPIGSVTESVTVTGGAPLVNTQDAAVSTVVDRNFAENLPMNGRSFQTLIQLTPGVVLTSNNGGSDNGQFSINGQRAASNYWMLDGVSANIGTSASFGGNGPAGAIGSFSALGGTNSLVSVDALEEFRIQTSTYAPEFGRTPGAQISIVTRSGTNHYHGTLFDYIRNDIFDANDWFNGTTNPPLPKAKERQNDFGGTFDGPIFKDRTFFFFSYEGLRLRLPQTALTDVPDLLARQNATPAMKPYLNVFPVPNGSDNPATGVAQFNASYSNSASLNAYSLRLDHKISDKSNIFGRYDYSPSTLIQRGNGEALNNVSPIRIGVTTATVGTTWSISPFINNDLRFNYSRANSSSESYQDAFGGAIPLESVPIPAPFTTKNASFFVGIFSLAGGQYDIGANVRNIQHQINLIDSIAILRGSHSMKLGIDFRRLSPSYAPYSYGESAFFNDISSADSGNLSFSEIQSLANATLAYRNLGVFAQDTWRIAPRITITYGLRWDIDFTPSSVSGPNIPGVTGFNLNDLSGLALAPAGTPPFKTTYTNVAPRVGIAYEFFPNKKWMTVLRGGFGLFYDLATSEAGNVILQASYPFGGIAYPAASTFPLDSASLAPPPISPSNLSTGTLSAFDPHLELPYTLQWNASLEQALGTEQILSLSYIGAAGRRLLDSAYILAPNPQIATANLVTNQGASDYQALQVQYQKRLSAGLQALASYTWSHSIDNGSAGSIGDPGNAVTPRTSLAVNRGPSDFDIRHSFSAGVTYNIPQVRANAVVGQIVRDWSLENVFQARSAPPVNVFDTAFYQLFGGYTHVRPDVLSGIPLYLFGSQYPGGKSFNNTPGVAVCPNGSASVGPFCPPPTDAQGNPLGQGDLGRNALRGVGAFQWDLAVHREFPIREKVKLQFRAEMFNIVNHPNFGQPVGDINNPQFGQSTQMLGRSLGAGSLGAGAMSSLYQLGGPRSVQVALKLSF